MSALRPRRLSPRPDGKAARRSLCVAMLMLLPASASGDPALTVDLKSAPVGTWAEYTVKVGAAAEQTMKTRWALLHRDADGNTLVLTLDGPAAATPRVGKVVTRMVLA